MIYAVDAERARICANEAMDRMASLDIAPTPDNYALWYEHALGLNTPLVEGLNALLDAKGPVRQDELDKLQAEFMSVAKVRDAVEEVGGRMQAELTRVLEFVENAGKDSTVYGTALDQAGQHMQPKEPDAPFARVLDTLVAATRHMQARTQSLETELQRSSHEISQLKDNLDTIHKETLTDPLTGLTNRRGFDEEISHCFRVAEKTKQNFSLIIADLDHFKRINDTFGHLTGDQILRLAARCVSEAVKGRDTAARYGGEEFAILLPGTGRGGAMAVAEQIRKAVQSKKVVKRSTGEAIGTVTISLGVTEWSSLDTIDSLIERADACLYTAKREGRNRVIACDNPAVQGLDVLEERSEAS